MHFTNFCTTCGASLPRKGWRHWIRGPVCSACSRRRGGSARVRSLIVMAEIVFGAFALGRSLRPAPPPLTIQRAANSPLADLPVNFNEIAKRGATNLSQSEDPGINDTVYICGARTKKGTPCKRRVHVAGDRCYQHKGMPAMVPLEKLVIKQANLRN